MLFCFSIAISNIKMSKPENNQSRSSAKTDSIGCKGQTAVKTTVKTTMKTTVKTT